jgi:hypothetical protein
MQKHRHVLKAPICTVENTLNGDIDADLELVDCYDSDEQVRGSREDALSEDDNDGEDRHSFETVPLPKVVYDMDMY